MLDRTPFSAAGANASTSVRQTWHVRGTGSIPEQICAYPGETGWRTLLVQGFG